MEQRRLRLGDILDDYCPRERRVTNHAVVAMIEADVKQTRCTTCDAEHVYKGGKAPRRKKAETTGALYKEVLAGIEDPAPPVSEPEPEYLPAAALPSDAVTAAPIASIEEDQNDADDADNSDEILDDDSQLHMLPPDEGPVHRPLIRAQLPRPDGMKIERQAPEFTIRQNNNSRGGFRGRGNPNGNGHGTGNAGGSHRFGRGAHRAGGGGGGRGAQGFGRGPGGGQPRHSGPRKRSR